MLRCWIGGAFPKGDVAVCSSTLKTSKESGFSGVAAVTPIVFPVGRMTYTGLDDADSLGGGNTHLVCREAWFLIHSDLKDGIGVSDADDGWPSKVTVRIVAMSEGQAVYAPVALVIRRTVVEESPDTTTLARCQPQNAGEDCTTYPPTMSVHNQGETIPLADGVYASRANFVLSVFGIPKLEISPSPLNTSRSELELCCPFRMGKAVKVRVNSSFIELANENR